MYLHRNYAATLMNIQRTFHNDYFLAHVSIITAFPCGFFMRSLTDTHCGPLSHRKSILFCCWKLHCRFPCSVWGDFPSTSRRCWCVSLKATEKQKWCLTLSNDTLRKSLLLCFCCEVWHVREGACRWAPQQSSWAVKSISSGGATRGSSVSLTTNRRT